MPRTDNFSTVSPIPLDALSILTREAKGLWSHGRGPILVAIAGGWFLSIGVRMIYPILLPHLRTAYGLDLTTAGLLLTVLFVAYGLGQFPGGLLADRFGEKAILIVSSTISVATLALIVTAGSTAVLFAVTALFGVGVALYAVARYTILADLYPERVGAANGVVSGAADLGQSILPPIAGFLAAVLAWQFGFAFAIPLFALAAVALWLAVPSHRSESTRSADRPSFESARAVLSGLRIPAVVYGTGLLLLGVTVWQAFTGFYPTYLIDEKGLSATLAGVLFGLFFALGVVVQPLSGAAYDRIGVGRTLVFVMGVAAVGLVILTQLESFWPLAAVTVLLSTLLGFATVTQTHLILALPDDIQGTGFGILRTISFTVGASSPVLVGAAADRGFFDEAFLALAALAGLTVLLGFVTPAANE
ncbi:Nitrate/nitrite transporter NarK [Halorubrum vacuolatum]|uniref:Nitrate/nitrite transporter NarK n=1 Tax=Halorubrum vacuolatum TaxID=63740 RepID=A0A238XAC1_HALVU|nr:Nitrate/nitrite transporter NarK [Halorubrum vacuolatum]